MARAGWYFPPELTQKMTPKILGYRIQNQKSQSPILRTNEHKFSPKIVHFCRARKIEACGVTVLYVCCVTLVPILSTARSSLKQVRFIGDQNPFRESSAGVQFFGVSALNPELYTIQKGDGTQNPMSCCFLFIRGIILS